VAILNGKLTRDVLNGTSSSDKLYGNGGNDDLYGGSGKDELYGGDGNDLLVGGSSPDLLYGGAGADTFRLVDHYDSKRWENMYDEIKDFSRAEGDKIDLSVLDARLGTAGNQAFEFGAGSGDGKVWTERQGADLFVNAKIQNGTAIRIKLDDFSGQLTADDFIL